MKKITLLFIVAMAGCAVNTSEKVELEKLSFNYSDDAYIFFRNMRQTHYDLEVMEEGGWRIYRHEDRLLDTTDFYFNISLVVNWRVNKIYPIIEMPSSIEKKGFEVLWESIETAEKGSIRLDGEKRNNEMIFSSKLYNKMVEEVEIFIEQGDQRKPLFQNAAQKEAFRVSMYDFFRMTGNL
jgi:hypothetical protein